MKAFCPFLNRSCREEKCSLWDALCCRCGFMLIGASLYNLNQNVSSIIEALHERKNKEEDHA